MDQVYDLCKERNFIDQVYQIIRERTERNLTIKVYETKSIKELHLSYNGVLFAVPQSFSELFLS